MRAPLWLIFLLILAIIFISVYAYFTTPLPLGLSSVIRTPGGNNVPSASSPTVGVSAGTEKQLFKWIASPLQLRREVQERQVRP